MFLPPEAWRACRQLWNQSSSREEFRNGVRSVLRWEKQKSDGAAKIVSTQTRVVSFDEPRVVIFDGPEGIGGEKVVTVRQSQNKYLARFASREQGWTGPSRQAALSKLMAAYRKRNRSVFVDVGGK